MALEQESDFCLTISASFPLRGLFLLMVALALLSIVISPIGLGWQLGLLLFVVALALQIWFGRAELGGRPLTLIYAQQRWWWLSPEGTQQPLELCCWYIWPDEWIVMSWRRQSWPYSLAAVLWGQGLDREVLRQIRVLWWRGGSGEEHHERLQ
ncbi:hypothetical protein D5085_11385 [Ectothiorhodospiraceae bacterium BW-2]|nr:hypothetical protein D5085_11385 [Ectothiorhodospiraceae bacterium BW-2]